MEESINHWYNKLWITKGSRFNAYRRVKSIHLWSTVSIIMFSVYIIGINLLVFMSYFSDDNIIEIITVVTIILSIFVLSISVFLNSRDYKVEYLNHHKMGIKITNLYSQVALLKDNKDLVKKIKKIGKEYDRLLKCSHYNHSQIDYEKTLLESDENQFGFVKSIIINLRYNLLPILIYIFLIFIPPIIFWIIISKMS